MNKDKLIEQIELAEAAFTQLAPGLKDQVGERLIRDTMQTLILLSDTPGEIRTKSKELLSFLDIYTRPIMVEKYGGAEKVKIIVLQCFDSLKKVISRYDI
jgi:hypothetical protein